MRHKKIFTFVIVYVFLVLIVAYSFFLWRGKQIDQFLEDKKTEYESYLNCTNREVETIEDWASVHSCEAQCFSMEYLVQETERIQSSQSKNPFLPYKKAFSYCEMWNAVVYARADTLDDFWTSEEGNLYARMEKMCEGNTCADTLKTEEYHQFVQEIIESTKMFQGKDIDTMYEEIMEENADTLSPYNAVIQERRIFAEKAHKNYEESVNKGDFVGSLVYSRVIFALWTPPYYKGTLFWFDEAGNCVFDELTIHVYVDLFMIFVVPLFVLSVLWLAQTKLKR